MVDKETPERLANSLWETHELRRKAFKRVLNTWAISSSEKEYTVSLAK